MAQNENDYPPEVKGLFGNVARLVSLVAQFIDRWTAQQSASAVFLRDVHSPNFGVTIGAGTATRILTLNPTRRIAAIVNDSAAEPVYISLGPNPAVNTGIRLNAAGGSFTFGRDTDFPYQGEVWAISTNASSVTVIEG